MKISQELLEAIHVVACINACLEETNESGQINYLILRTNGDIFEIKFLSQYIFSSENDSVEEVETCSTAHGEGLTGFGKKLEQFLWDKMIEFVNDVEIESKWIHSYSSVGRGINP